MPLPLGRGRGRPARRTGRGQSWREGQSGHYLYTGILRPGLTLERGLWMSYGQPEWKKLGAWLSAQGEGVWHPVIEQLSILLQLNRI